MDLKLLVALRLVALPCVAEDAVVLVEGMLVLLLRRLAGTRCRNAADMQRSVCTLAGCGET